MNSDMTAEKKFVKEVIIQDVEKRRQPSKHYVYRVKVSWSDGKINLIYRRYSQFFSLQDSLINLYPQESGASDPAKRIIPLLPGKILFGRSQIREVALKRKELINEYLQKLIKLPEHISQSALVIAFLTVTQEDALESSSTDDKSKDKGQIKSADNISDPILLEQYVVIANFEKSDRNQISLASGDTVEVIEKNDNGWWFVTIEDEQGWAPSSYLEPIDGVREDERELMVEGVEKFICIKDYNVQQRDELTLKLGDIVNVKVKQRDGWWKVKLCVDSGVPKEGIVPAAHLRKFIKHYSTSEDVEEPKKITAPPRQNTVKNIRRARPGRPKRPPVIKSNAVASSHQSDEEVVYVCARDYIEVDSGGTHVNIKAGAEMSVLEKSPNGWWRIISNGEEGWIPSSVAQRKRRLKSEQATASNGQKMAGEKSLYMTKNSYLSDERSVLSFEAGKLVEVIDKDPNGWWYVKLDTNEGWAPSNYLEKYDSKHRASLNNVIIEAATEDDSYENAVVVNSLPKIDLSELPRTSSKPSILPKPKPDLLPKPSVKPRPKPRPSPKPPRRATGPPENITHKNRLSEPIKPVRPDLLPETENIYEQPIEPSSYINSAEVGLGAEQTSGEIYVTMADYEDDDDTMLSFKAGQLLLVTKKENNGWWFAEHGDQGGWVPSNYLQK